MGSKKRRRQLGSQDKRQQDSLHSEEPTPKGTIRVGVYQIWGNENKKEENRSHPPRKENKKTKRPETSPTTARPVGITRGRDAPVEPGVFRQWRGGKYRPGRRMGGSPRRQRGVSLALGYRSRELASLGGGDTRRRFGIQCHPAPMIPARSRRHERGNRRQDMLFIDFCLFRLQAADQLDRKPVSSSS